VGVLGWVCKPIVEVASPEGSIAPLEKLLRTGTTTPPPHSWVETAGSGYVAPSRRLMSSPTAFHRFLYNQPRPPHSRSTCPLERPAVFHLRSIDR
jgi:hypothetical protein